LGEQVRVRRFPVALAHHSNAIGKQNLLAFYSRRPMPFNGSSMPARRDASARQAPKRCWPFFFSKSNITAAQNPFMSGLHSRPFFNLS
jgi:hypothetical protein